MDRPGVIIQCWPKGRNMRYTGLSETEGVKRLLILLLLKLGTSSKEIGMALNINSSVIRRMFPGKEIRRIKSLK